MRDTTMPVSKEVVVTTALFLFILIVGTVAFDLYNHYDSNVITAAAVAGNSSNDITGGVVGYNGQVAPVWFIEMLSCLEKGELLSTCME